MTLSNRTVLLALSLTACAVTIAMGCKQSVHIELAPSYTGPVNIVCDAVADTTRTIIIDSAGNGEAHSCPPRGAELVFLRDGKPFTPDGPVLWQTTGDGIVVGIHFNAR
jgi:hypothetical protein